MFDPNKPANGAPLVSAEMRGQLNGLKDLIDAIGAITSAQVDATNTISPGQPAGVSVSVSSGVLHFTFDVPQGTPGIDGINGTPGTAGSNGTNGNDGAPGIQGPPGEVTTAQLDTAISGTSSNTNSVALLNLTPGDPPSQNEIQQLASKLDELITALRR